MAAPTTTIWDLEPHTRAKHELLRRYLGAWVPILGSSGHKEILYIDGFAGPGRYSKGEDGSPVIALRAVLDQKKVDIKSRVLFLFVEKDMERAAMLGEIVAGMNLPKERIRVKVAGGQTFAAAFTELHGFYAKKSMPLPPTFAFIDPFGWTGVPFSIVRQIMSYERCEVFVNFMFEEVSRFLAHPDQTQNFDDFFGTPEWRDGVNLADRARNRFLHDLYARQLRTAAGATYVRSFEMRNERNVTDYFLFYGTKSLTGLAKMKEAMWRVDEAGEFTFSDATDPNQLVLFERRPRLDVLRRQIVEHFRGREVAVREVEQFVLAETAFRETHYKQGVLKILEGEEPPGLAVVNPPPDRRKGTYPTPSMRIRFT